MSAGRPRAFGVIHWGIAGLFLLHGALGAFESFVAGPRSSLPWAAFEIALGIGLMLRFRWSRWLALGACFFAVLGAFVIPVFAVLERQVAASFAAPGLRPAITLSALAIALGAVGYKGLEYFRSPQGRADFTGKSVEELARHPESSAMVIFSAAVWLVLLIGSSLLGRALNQWTFDEKPDLVVIDLCQKDRHVYATYTNVGSAGASGEIAIVTTVRHAGRLVQNHSYSTVPAPGEIRRTDGLSLDTHGIADGSEEDFSARVDELGRVAESDETNNALRKRITIDSYRPTCTG